MNKREKHSHPEPYSKVKKIEKLLAESDFGKTKWHRIFGLCLVLRPYDDNGNTLIKSGYKGIRIYNDADGKWTDIFSNTEDGFISQVVNKRDLFDTAQNDEEQKNLATRIKIIS